MILPICCSLCIYYESLRLSTIEDAIGSIASIASCYIVVVVR